MVKTYRLIVEKLDSSTGRAEGRWGNQHYKVIFGANSRVTLGSFVRFRGEVSEDAIACTELCEVREGHPLGQKTLECEYAWLLSALRSRLTDAIELRPPSISLGMAKDSFMFDYFGKVARLLGSHALYCTLGAIRYGRCYSVARVFRRETAVSSRHLREFDLFQYGALDADVGECMDFTEGVLRSLYRDAESAWSCSCSLKLPDDPFARISWDDLRRQTPLTVSDDNVASCENVFLKDLWRKCPLPVFVTEIPSRFASWTASRDGRDRTTTFNLIAPNIGELAEGSRRNTRVSELRERLCNSNALCRQFDWYFTGLTYEDIPVSVVGVGVERMAMWLFGVSEIARIRPFTSACA